jgi:hypothetical protein
MGAAGGLGSAAANKRSVRVIGLVGNVPRARFRGDELHFADEIAAPSSVDSIAQLALHALNLLLPCFRVSRYFEKGAVAPHRPRVSCERFPCDCWPRTCEPRKRGFRTIEPADDFSKKFSRSLHGSGILTQTGDGGLARLHRRFKHAKIASTRCIIFR